MPMKQRLPELTPEMSREQKILALKLEQNIISNRLVVILAALIKLESE